MSTHELELHELELRDSGPYHDLVADVTAAAMELERGCDLRAEQLGELRCATRRLRRAIEAFAIDAATSCRCCGELFVPGAAGTAYCSQRCSGNDAGRRPRQQAGHTADGHATRAVH